MLRQCIPVSSPLPGWPEAVNRSLRSPRVLKPRRRPDGCQGGGLVAVAAFGTQAEEAVLLVRVGYCRSDLGQEGAEAGKVRGRRAGDDGGGRADRLQRGNLVVGVPGAIKASPTLGLHRHTGKARWHTAEVDGAARSAFHKVLSTNRGYRVARAAR